jgi:hypothetical protein
MRAIPILVQRACKSKAFCEDWSDMAKPQKDTDQFSEKEAQARFEAALRGGLNAPHKPLKDKPKAKKKPPEKKGEAQ